MVKAWARANKVRENYMGPERPQVVIEEDEQLQEDSIPDSPGTDGNGMPPQPPEPDLGAEDDGQGAPKLQGPGKGQGRKITEYFNNIGGQNPSNAPKRTQNGARAPETPIIGGIRKKSTRKKKNKIEEPERARMELALRTFLREKKPPDQNN